ncbi:GNAT family N-acetyltransferase [Pseudomaricurvus sp.]|uniref:GNAT family N-acetyltransferase n=1 Tax=Pseudomaricurvus sp. TaxID=2004510 RepID=UPI003F6AE189
MDWSLYPISEYADWSDKWDQLNFKAGNSQLLSTQFIQPLIDNFAPEEAKLAICQDGSDIVCMSVISPEKSTGWSSFQPSQAPIGLWIQLPEISTASLINTLLPKLPGLKWVFSLTQQDPDLLSRSNDNHTLTSMDYIQTARLDTRGDFDEYFSQRSKNHRQNLRRQRNRLEREGITPRLETIQDASMVDECITDYGRLESSGWKQQLDTAIHQDNPQGAFYTSMLTSFMREGKATIYRYWYNDDLVAMDLAIHNDDTMVILKTTYDESIKTSSPGVLMHQEIFQSLFESKTISCVEFYGKLMDWHQKWTKDIRTMYHLTHYSWQANLAKKTLNITRPVRKLIRL